MVSVIVVYATVELLLALYIVASNVLVLGVFVCSRRVRTVTNTYIFSLATCDFLAGALGIPLAVFSVLTQAPHTYASCVAVHSVLRVLCAVSTMHLLAIALDKYVSICCGHGVFRRAGRGQRAALLLTGAWLLGSGASILPLLCFARARTDVFDGLCRFSDVIDQRYLVYVLFVGTTIVPSVAIVFCYASIYSCIRAEERRVRCLLGGRERRRRLRSRRKLLGALSLLVLTYGVCWYPLYLINTLQLIFPDRYRPDDMLTLTAVILSHASCAINPLIYAYGVPGFKQALHYFLRRRHASDSIQRCYSSHYKSVFSDQTNSPKYSVLIPKYSITVTSYGGASNHQQSRVPRKISEPVAPAKLRSMSIRRSPRLSCDRMLPPCMEMNGRCEI